jgi:hypothetical protein
VPDASGLAPAPTRAAVLPCSRCPSILPQQSSFPGRKVHAHLLGCACLWKKICVVFLVTDPVSCCQVLLTSPCAEHCAPKATIQIYQPGLHVPKNCLDMRMDTDTHAGQCDDCMPEIQVCHSTSRLPAGSTAGLETSKTAHVRLRQVCRAALPHMPTATTLSSTAPDRPPTVITEYPGPHNAPHRTAGHLCPSRGCVSGPHAPPLSVSLSHTIL